jgi:hypothetical protein
MVITGTSNLYWISGALPCRRSNSATAGHRLSGGTDIRPVSFRGTWPGWTCGTVSTPGWRTEHINDGWHRIRAAFT